MSHNIELSNYENSMYSVIKLFNLENTTIYCKTIKDFKELFLFPNLTHKQIYYYNNFKDFSILDINNIIEDIVHLYIIFVK